MLSGLPEDWLEGVAGLISPAIGRYWRFWLRLEAKTRTLLSFRRFGSGYPNATTEGVEGRGFPFFFLPISYGPSPGYGLSDIYDHEYGKPDNKRRPGGPLHFLTIQPPKSLVEGPYPDIPHMTLYVIADKSTLAAIKSAIMWLCPRSDLSPWVFADKVRVSKPKKLKGPAEDPNGPVPEQAVGYYRGSSVALLLAGYNNSAQVIDTNLEDTPLPSLADTAFFQCINRTIRESVPLVISKGAVPFKANATPPTATPPLVFSTSIALVIVVFHILF
jgi:hypothetical protein